MIVIELTYKKPLLEADKYLEDHRNFLQKYYDHGLFIASGAKIPREGGVIISHTTLDTAKNLVKDDPFYVHDIASYRFIEFDASRYIDELADKLQTE